MHHRLAITYQLLVLDRASRGTRISAGSIRIRSDSSFTRRGSNSEVMKIIQASAFRYPLFSAWVYYVIVAVCFVISFLWDFAYARTVQMLAISSYLYYLSIFIFSMSGDFRYNVWMLTCAYICPLLLLAGRTRRTSTTPEESCDRLAQSAALADDSAAAHLIRAGRRLSTTLKSFDEQPTLASEQMISESGVKESPGGERLAEWLTWAAAVILLTIPALTLIMSAGLYHDVPWGDQIGLFLQTALNQHFRLGALFQFHNEHQIVLTKLAIYADSWLLHGRNLLPFGLSVIFALAIPLISVWLMAKSGPKSRKEMALTGALLLALYLNGRQTWALTCPILLQHFSADFAVLVAFVAATGLIDATRRRDTVGGKKTTIIFGLACVCAALCSASGLLIGPSILGVITLLLWPWKPKPPRAAVRVGILTAVTTFVVSSVYVGSYLVNHAHGAAIDLDVVKILGFVFLFLGAPFWRNGEWPVPHHPNMFALAGVAGVFWVTLLWIGIQLYRRRKRLSREELFHACVIVFVILTALLGAIFRSQFGIMEAINKKYAPTALLAWLSVTMLILRFRPAVLWGRLKGLRILALSIVVVTVLLPGDLLEFRIWRSWKDQLSESASTVASGVYNSNLLKRFWYSDQEAYLILKQLVDSRTYCFRRMPPPGYMISDRYAVVGIAGNSPIPLTATPQLELPEMRGFLLSGAVDSSAAETDLVLTNDSGRVVGYGGIAEVMPEGPVPDKSRRRRLFAAVGERGASSSLKVYAIAGSTANELGIVTVPALPTSYAGVASARFEVRGFQIIMITAWSFSMT